MTSVDAAPLLCAGVTTYNSLRSMNARAGDIVAVQGIGGLGHLGIQYGRKLGFRTVRDLTSASLYRRWTFRGRLTFA
jgi:D-arabinose 1-dehydrogenase-like Zn-dependent alcohol dehydrogenase